MKELIKRIIVIVLFLNIFGVIHLGWVDIASACGWGQSGGGDYVPQRRDNSGFLAKKSPVTESQARDIVTNYVKRLNPELEIGKITDNGGFYEIEILAEGKEVIQLLGVDKRSGRLILLN